MNPPISNIRILTPRKTISILTILSLLLVASSVFALSIGTTDVSLSDFFNVLSGRSEEDESVIRIILFEIRLPRILLALIVGAGLSLAGATFQALLRNPLAEPYILGISSGGTLGAVLSITLGLGLTQLTTPLFAFLGSGIVMILVYFLGHRRGFIDPNTLLLSGVMIGAFFNAIILLLLSVFHHEIRAAFMWLLGNLSNANFSSLIIIGPLVILSSIPLLFFARSFNAIATGDEMAMHLGVDVTRARRISYFLASVITGLAVSVSGIIGFVGLIVPHACRLLFGPDNRLLLPASVLVGGTFLVLSDLIARTILSPAEIPVGVVTAVIGAPVFIYLLKKNLTY